MFRKVTFLVPTQFGKKQLYTLSAPSLCLILQSAAIAAKSLNVLCCAVDNQKPDEVVGFKALCVLLNNLHLHMRAGLCHVLTIFCCVSRVRLAQQWSLLRFFGNGGPFSLSECCTKGFFFCSVSLQKNNEMSNELVVEGEDSAPMSEVSSRTQMDAIEELQEEEEEQE